MEKTFFEVKYTTCKLLQAREVITARGRQAAVLCSYVTFPWQRCDTGAKTSTSNTVPMPPSSPLKSKLLYSAFLVGKNAHWCSVAKF